MRVGRIRGNQTSGALRTSLLTLWAQPSHHKVEPWGSGDRGTGCPQLPLLEGGCLAEEGGGGEGVQALLQSGSAYSKSVSPSGQWEGAPSPRTVALPDSGGSTHVMNMK